MSAVSARERALQRLRPKFAQKPRIYRGLSAAAKPNPELSIVDWAEQRRHVASDAGSPRPGKWSNATTPFAIEMMECLSPDHPAHLVTLMCASQLVKTEVGLNWIGQTIDVDPASFLVLEPSLDEVRLFSATRFDPMVSATPALKGKVYEVIERSRAGSTTKTKRFRGGTLHIGSAGASKDLQQKSVKRVFADEVSEYPEDAGGRGDPLDQAIARTDGHADYKVLAASTPKELPTCRITALYERGDRRRYYVACPDCGARQTLELEQLVRQGDAVAYVCAACGVLVGEEHKTAMLAGGVWLKTYPSESSENPAPPAVFEGAELERWRARATEGREPSFHLSQLYSPFKTWSRLLKEAEDADTQEKKKTFRQQKLGLAWDPAVDAPDHEALAAAKGAQVERGVVPAWACLLTGAADVQNDRIEWATYAWGPHQMGARIDWGVCEGDTATSAPYVELAKVVQRRWPGRATVPLGLDWFGIDSGGAEGRTAKVYEFVRNAIGLKALKGSSKHDSLPLEPGARVKAKTRAGRTVRVQIWLVGTWAVKKTIYTMLHRGLTAYEEGERLPVALYYTADTPEEHFKQLTAEVFKEPRSKRVGAVGQWERIAGRANEQLDLAVYCYAGAWDKGLERWTEAEWAQLFAARAKPVEDAPLLDFAAIEASRAPAQTEPPAAPASSPQVAKLAPNPKRGGTLPGWMEKLVAHNTDPRKPKS